MNSDKKYNGWSNYETWLVKLFLDGNYTGMGDYDHYQDIARSYVDMGSGPYHLSKELQESLESMTDDIDLPSILSDLLNSAMSEVNWYELAESLLGDIQEEEEE